MFKPDHKKQVSLKFIELFGKDHKVTVVGGRVSPEDCKRQGIRCTTRDGIYFTELFIDGHQVATAGHSDWRKAYKLLKLEVEKLYAEGVALV